MSHPNPTDDARRIQAGVVDLQLARLGEPRPSDNTSERSRSDRAIVKQEPTEIGSWDYVSPPRETSPSGKQHLTQINLQDRRTQENYLQESFLQEQHLHLHAGADVGLVEAVAQLRHEEITREMRDRFNQEAMQTMHELREHAQERFGEAISASRNQLLTEANEELQRRSTQANELLEAERRRNRELQQRLEQAQSSVGRLEKKMDEQALALQRVGDENAEAVLREDRLTKRLEEQQRMVSDLLVANEAARTLAAGNRKPNPSVPIISIPSEKSCVSRSNYGTPLIEELGDEAAGDYADDAKDHLRPPGPPGPPDDNHSSDSDDGKKKKSKKDKKKKKKKASKRGRSPKKKGRDGSPPSSPSSSSSSSSTSSSEFRKKIDKYLSKRDASSKRDEVVGTSRAREAEKIHIPKFPNPEQYRNWRIRVRDAVSAASPSPDEAFAWIGKVWVEGKTVDDLKDSGTFVTLDAKLLSGLTNIAEGDLGRQIDTFKEVQAKSGVPAKGRHVLFMFHQHFATSIKHGSVYDIEDLMSVTLVNDDLKSFITRWDSVIAGMNMEVEDKWLEAYFHKNIKKFRPLSHDFAIYDRAPEGSAEKTYKFLITSARNYLERKRLDKMRDATKRSLSGGTSSAAPAASSSPKKGPCWKFAKGECNDKNCRFRHETDTSPSKRGGGKGRGKSRSSSKSSSKSSGRALSPGSRSQVCNFWKAGKCRRGKECAFQHPDDKKPASPAPKDRNKKSEKKNNKKKGKKRSDSKGSNSSNGSKKSGGNASSSAAVCLLKALVLVAAVRPSTGLDLCRPEGWAFAAPCPTKMRPKPNRSVSFSSEIEKTEFTIPNDNNFWDYGYNTARQYSKEYAISYKPNKQKSHQAQEDAILSAQMLQSAVFRELHDHSCSCGFMCDSDIGCVHCIREDLEATPFSKGIGMPVTEIAWIADTGSAQDLISKKFIELQKIRESQNPLELITANGPYRATEETDVKIPVLSSEISPYVLEDTPAVISVGRRCVDEDWDFVWKGSKQPYFKKPDGEKIKLNVKDYVPYLPSKNCFALAAIGHPYKDSESAHGDGLSNDFIPRGKAIPAPEADAPLVIDPGGELVPAERDERLAPPVRPEKENRGEMALKAEALSLRHLMSHTPKNPFCETCQRAKMTKSVSRKSDGSTLVEAENFGDHITADHLITRDEREESIDGDRVALVIKDVATNFRYIYPAARKSTRECVAALKHFTSHTDKVGVFYSDGAPELISAANELGWRHQTSVGYVSMSNAVAERNLRAALDGTRVNLEQAGLHHSYWPHAARHFCMSQNIVENPDRNSPWFLRFDEKFKGPCIPFGARIDYWIGPKTKPKDILRFDPTSLPGIFLGYAIHPEFAWRKEYNVIPLKDTLESDFDKAITVIRVNQITVPKGSFTFPLKERYEAIREGRVEGFRICDKPPDPKEQDAVMPPEESEAPEPAAGSDGFRGDGEESLRIDIHQDILEVMEEKGETISVVDPKTGKMVSIPKDSKTLYDAGGTKARRYKGSKKPDSIPSFLWATLSQKQRERAIEEEAKKLEIKKRAASVATGDGSPEHFSIANESDDEFPLMPVMPCTVNHEHREKIATPFSVDGYSALVARPVGQKEISNVPEAQKSLDVEWEKLERKMAWDYATVNEWEVLSREARKQGIKIHVGKVFEICVEKGSELEKGNPPGKYKGRTVFQGNNVKDEASETALFAELGSSPANMEAGKSIDCYGCMPGNKVSQSDGKQAYTQALMKGVKTVVRIPRNRGPKEWIGKYKDPVVDLRIALYGHPDSGGLWEKHCEAMLNLVGFRPLHPDCWSSMFWHDELRLLLAVYVDDFKMAGPAESIDKGWKLISSKIDMEPPEDVGRYLGCEHVTTRGVRLTAEHHPFAHVYDHTIQDPANQPAAAAHRSQDHWEHFPEHGVLVHCHVQPRKKFSSLPRECGDLKLGPSRCTEYKPCTPEGDASERWDDVENNKQTGLPYWWTGFTYFVDENVKQPQIAVAAVKQIRDKGKAKKAVRAQGFTYLDQLVESQACMNKPVNTMEYNMKGFLQQCLDRYVELAGGNVKFKNVSTPFYDDRIARPIGDEQERRGELQAISSKVLMKVLFAARMARFDLLRATQGLASRVTKWSVDCDKALFRLMCYIHSTLDHTMIGFTGDSPQDIKLWLFADSDHAGEHDSRSTSGCMLALVGPNTYFPLTAFSKKQTSTAMSSTEAEVTAANLAVRATGLPSSCLWQTIRQAGGSTKATNCKAEADAKRNDRRAEAAVGSKQGKRGETDDYWEVNPGKQQVVRIHRKARSKLFHPEDDEPCPIELDLLSRQRYTIMNLKDDLEFDLTWDWTSPYASRITDSWTGKTIFRISGPDEVDYGIESREIRCGLTDEKYVGTERVGQNDIYLIGQGDFEPIVLEDNQATIRIIESGRSPAFRHCDKTQRLNLGWLAEQFRRKHFKLVYVPSLMQAADILTKPFTNAEKWGHALSLLGIRDTGSSFCQVLKKKSQCTGEPAAPVTSGPHNRVILEVCCSPDSKLGDETRGAARGCKVIRCTEERDITKQENRASIRREVIQSVRGSGNMCPLLIWISIPCTGGSTWSYVNLQHETAREKVLHHRKEFKKIWSGVTDLINSISSIDFFIVIEWPLKCIYWGFDRVVKFCESFKLLSIRFDGCSLGVMNLEGIPIEKAWQLMGNCPEVLNAFDKCRCPQNHEHVQGRGLDLKLTEEYTYQITDLIHQSFRAAALKRSSSQKRKPSLVAINIMSAEQANLDQATDVTMTDAGTHSGEPAVTEAPEAAPTPMEAETIPEPWIVMNPCDGEPDAVMISKPDKGKGKGKEKGKMKEGERPEYIAHYRVIPDEELLDIFTKNAQGDLVPVLVSDSVRETNRDIWYNEIADMATMASVVRNGHEIGFADVKDVYSQMKPGQEVAFLVKMLRDINPLCREQELFKNLSLNKLGALKAPLEPAVDFIFVGDSSAALLERNQELGCLRHHVGSFIRRDSKILLGEPVAGVYYGMKWGQGLKEILDDADHIFENYVRRRGNPVVLIVSYAGNDVYGRWGFVGNDWIDGAQRSRNPKWRDAGINALQERAEEHFEQVNRLVETMANGNKYVQIVLVMPEDHTAFDLPEDYGKQLRREGKYIAEKNNIIWLTGTNMLKNTTRSDRMHADDTPGNRREMVRFYAAAARLGHQLWKMRTCKPLLEESKTAQIFQQRSAEAEARPAKSIAEKVEAFAARSQEVEPEADSSEQVRLEDMFHGPDAIDNAKRFTESQIRDHVVHNAANPDEVLKIFEDVRNEEEDGEDDDEVLLEWQPVVDVKYHEEQLRKRRMNVTGFHFSEFGPIYLCAGEPDVSFILPSRPDNTKVIRDNSDPNDQPAIDKSEESKKMVLDLTTKSLFERIDAELAEKEENEEASTQPVAEASNQF